MDNMFVGVDIVDIPKLQEKIKRSGLFLQKVLTEQESSGLPIESIAGKIAAKEAIIKTGFIKPGEWKKIAIFNAIDGNPMVLDIIGNKINAIKISISHTSTMAIAVALYEKNESR